MCEHELLDFCGLRQLCGLVCGKVAFFECERSVFVGERTFETDEVGVKEMWYEVLVVSRVTAIYVAPWMSWGEFFKGESVGFDGMVERKSRYPDLVVFKQYLVSGNDMVAHFKIDMTPADAEEWGEYLLKPFWRIDVDRVFASAEVHGGKQSGKPEDVVSMEMGNENSGHGLEFLVGDTELGLGSFSAINHVAVAIYGNYLTAAMTAVGGQRCSAS